MDWITSMIDIKLLRKNPEIVKMDLEKRYETEKTEWVDKILEYDKEKRLLQTEINELRHRRNILTTDVAKLRDQEKDLRPILDEAKTIPDKIKKIENEFGEYTLKTQRLLERIPNLTHESVPRGRDETENVVVRSWGIKPEFNFEPKDHIDLGLALDIMDIERAAKVSGARFYYLKGVAALLEVALIRLGFEVTTQEGFIPILPPVMVRREAIYGAGFLPAGEEDIYYVKDRDLCLVGTAEIPLAAMHMSEILDEDQLPLYYAGFSSCFRTEAGAHGRDTKGIFRVHQFDKLELFTYTTPETSWIEHEKLISVVEKIYQRLGLHYRIVNICSGELGATAAKKYDLEVWLPGQEKYREIVSCSNCTDYQARRLNIRVRKKTAEKPRLVHTLNSTAVAMGRVIVAILENFQQEDGSVIIPKGLKKFLEISKIEKP